MAYTNAAAAIIADLLAQARPPLQKTVHETDRAAGIVVADHDYFDNLLNTLPDAYQALARQGMYGDFFSFYLCDVVLKLNGKGGQPVYVKVAGQATGTVRAADETLLRTQPVRHRRRRLGADVAADRGRRAAVRQAAVPQPGQELLGLLRRGGRADNRRSGAGLGLSRSASVTVIELDGPRVLIKFNVDKNIRLGDRTEAAIKTKSLLGTKFLEVTPRGDGQLIGTDPAGPHHAAYQLPDALGDLATTISGLNTDQLSDSLAVLASTFPDTPPDLKVAVEGVARFSRTLDERDAQAAQSAGQRQQGHGRARRAQPTKSSA